MTSHAQVLLVPGVPAANDADVLARVESRLLQSVRGDGLLGAASSHLIDAPAAKRARPRLLLAFASMLRLPPSSEAVAAACAVELIHTASLLHDDVVDESNERRGRPSTNARFGNSTAVLAGDALLASALRLLAYDARSVAAAVDAVAAMSVAAVREVETRGRADLSFDEQRAIADGKTAALFGLCGRLAGLLANDLDAAQRMEQAARAIGIAFQIADDAGDLYQDLIERTPTYPILLGARMPAVRSALERLWRDSLPHRETALAIATNLSRSTAVDDAFATVTSLVAEAERALQPWRGTAAYEQVTRFTASLLCRPACDPPRTEQ